MQNNTYNKLSSKYKKISFLEPERFNLIYQWSRIKAPSKLIGERVLGKPITKEELLFVLKHTRKGGHHRGLKNILI